MLYAPISAATGVVVGLFVVFATSDAGAASVSSTPALRVGAFNIKTFGKTKMSKDFEAWHIKEIVERYDILLIQEIRDKSVDSVRQLLAMLELPFDFVISEPIGRSTYKEQYAYFYRTDRAVLLGQYQYNDPADVFEREPFTVKMAPISNHNGGLFDSRAETLLLVGFHSKPNDATAEIAHITKVLVEAQIELGCDSEIVVMGDLNADCRYGNIEKRLAIKDFLTTSTSFTWLIDDNVDTTVKTTTTCAYDRIIVSSSLADRIVGDSAKAFDFGQHFELAEDEAYKVSDHYPVEVQLHF